jgi:hypothetical protein
MLFTGHKGPYGLQRAETPAFSQEDADRGSGSTAVKECWTRNSIVRVVSGSRVKAQTLSLVSKEMDPSPFARRDEGVSR